jgi:hypothetical protein
LGHRFISALFLGLVDFQGIGLLRSRVRLLRPVYEVIQLSICIPIRLVSCRSMSCPCLSERLSSFYMQRRRPHAFTDLISIIIQLNTFDCWEQKERSHSKTNKITVLANFHLHFLVTGVGDDCKKCWYGTIIDVRKSSPLSKLPKKLFYWELWERNEDAAVLFLLAKDGTKQLFCWEQSMLIQIKNVHEQNMKEKDWK